MIVFINISLEALILNEAYYARLLVLIVGIVDKFINIIQTLTNDSLILFKEVILYSLTDDMLMYYNH